MSTPVGWSQSMNVVTIASVSRHWLSQQRPYRRPKAKCEAVVWWLFPTRKGIGESAGRWHRRVRAGCQV